MSPTLTETNDGNDALLKAVREEFRQRDVPGERIDLSNGLGHALQLLGQDEF